MDEDGTRMSTFTREELDAAEVRLKGRYVTDERLLVHLEGPARTIVEGKGGLGEAMSALRTCLADVDARRRSEGRLRLNQMLFGAAIEALAAPHVAEIDGRSVGMRCSYGRHNFFATFTVQGRGSCDHHVGDARRGLGKQLAREAGLVREYGDSGKSNVELAAFLRSIGSEPGVDELRFIERWGTLDA